MASSWDKRKETEMLHGHSAVRSAHDSSITGLVHLVVGAVMITALSACSDNGFTDLKQYVASVKARPAGRIPPLPEFKTYETFAYSADTLRDPFEMFENEAELVQATKLEGAGIKPDQERNKETLEAYPLDTLRFVGQLEKDNETWAIVTSPDSLVHRVKVGNYIGQNYGKITAVTETQLEIRELVPDGMGGWIEREAALSLGE
jgi:type IV pilus assembly protein PilP